MSYQRLTLKEIGIRKYLDDTSAKHNDRDYDEFVKLIKLGVNKSNIARIFNVDLRTIQHWITVNTVDDEVIT